MMPCQLRMQQGNDLNATKDSSSGDGGIRLGRLKKSGLGTKAGAKGTIAGSTGILFTTLFCAELLDFAVLAVT
jgi:hypothetical protein